MDQAERRFLGKPGEHMSNGTKWLVRLSSGFYMPKSEVTPGSTVDKNNSLLTLLKHRPSEYNGWHPFLVGLESK
jgi:hypothetical protein